MTTDTGDHPMPGSIHPAATKSRWLIPGIAVGIAATALVIAGVISVTTLVYTGVIGGMLLMHLGHGAHRAHGAHNGQGGKGLDGSDDSGTPESDRASSADRPESHSCH